MPATIELPDAPPILRGYLSVSQAARRVGVTRQALARWIGGLADGRRLPSRWIGGRQYILPSDLDQFTGADSATA